MEGGAEAENTVVRQSSTFTWKIKNFSTLNAGKHYSEIFTAVNHKWRMLVYPKGNNDECLSLYLVVAHSVSLPCGWSRFAHFRLSAVNQIDSRKSVRKETEHHFNSQECDWGFTSLMPLEEVCDPSKGFLVHDTLMIEARVACKEESDYTGIKNQKEICYMTSLLQTLYHIPYFRKAVYHIPTNVNDMPCRSFPLALQRLFYKLQCGDRGVAAKEVIDSFGWCQDDASMQHNLQEFNRCLFQRLKGEMKGTFSEGTVQRLFEGHYTSIVQCMNVYSRSTTNESFYDLQLDVKGCPDVYASLDKFVEVKRLEANNKYHAGHYGLQDAMKGALFIDFPPVLQLHLKRFEYDFMRGTTMFINDHYEFPLQLDLDRANGKYLSPEANENVRNLYTLYSVLVHKGGVHYGHCAAFIRPILSDQWYMFDDDEVTEEDAKRALEEQYGGEAEPPQIKPGFNNALSLSYEYSSAYMLVYIRDSDKNKITCPVEENDIAEHVREEVKKEQEKEHESQAPLYAHIRVARDVDFSEQIGNDIFFDLVDHDKVTSFKVQRSMPFNDFKVMVSKQFHIPVQFMRFWLWVKRENGTFRPHRPLKHSEESQSVEALHLKKPSHTKDLNLFLEVEIGPGFCPIPLPHKAKDTILLFCKLYDPDEETLCYVGRLFVKKCAKPLVILEKLNEMAGFSPCEAIKLYEEIRFDPVMCELIDMELTFSDSELGDGDIVCFQKLLRVKTKQQLRYPDVPSFLEYLHSRQVVHFRSLEWPKEEGFSLEMSKLFSYDNVIENVAHYLGLDDPLKIRLTSHNRYSQQPKPQPLRYRGAVNLRDMLSHDNKISDILYYEVLDVPLPELSLKTVKLEFHHATTNEVSIHDIRLPKCGTVADVMNDLKTKIKLSHSNAEMRLLQLFHNRIYKIFLPGELIEHINDLYWTLRAEEIPEEEKHLGANGHSIPVYHFTKYLFENRMEVRNFGNPFFFVIQDEESLAEIKIRIQKKLKVPDVKFSKWKFAFISIGCLEYLDDADIVHNRFQGRGTYCPWEQYLGLEHTDTSLGYMKLTESIVRWKNQRRGGEVAKIADTVHTQCQNHIL